MLKVREINGFVEGELDRCEVGIRRLMFVISGTGIINISGNTLEVCRGRVYFLKDQDSLIAKAGCVVSGFLIVFNELFFDDFLLHYPRFRNLEVLEQSFVDSAGGDLLALLEELRWLKAEVESDVAPLRLKTRFNLVMLMMLGGLNHDKELDVKHVQLQAEFLQLLESNFRVRRTSGFYADKLGMSMRKLNSLCKIWFDGKGFISVHQGKLLSAAEYLLLNTDKSIKEIAFNLEFCSQQHFRGYFSRGKGICPSVFRQLHRVKD